MAGRRACPGHRRPAGGPAMNKQSRAFPGAFPAQELPVHPFAVRARRGATKLVAREPLTVRTASPADPARGATGRRSWRRMWLFFGDQPIRARHNLDAATAELACSERRGRPGPKIRSTPQRLTTALLVLDGPQRFAAPPFPKPSTAPGLVGGGLGVILPGTTVKLRDFHAQVPAQWEISAFVAPACIAVTVHYARSLVPQFRSDRCRKRRVTLPLRDRRPVFLCRPLCFFRRWRGWWKAYGYLAGAGFFL